MNQYKISNNGLYRSSVLSSETLRLGNRHKDIMQFYLTNSTFREQMYIANKEFYYYVDYLLKNDKVVDSKVIDTIYEYIKRSIYRTTPFGTFSGIGKLLIKNSNTKNCMVCQHFFIQF